VHEIRGARALPEFHDHHDPEKQSEEGMEVLISIHRRQASLFEL
jgi:hypothetical protein